MYEATWKLTKLLEFPQSRDTGTANGVKCWSDKNAVREGYPFIPSGRHDRLLRGKPGTQTEGGRPGVAAGSTGDEEAETRKKSQEAPGWGVSPVPQ